MGLYSHLVRPALFRLDGEASHRLTMRACESLGGLAPVRAWLAGHVPADPRLRSTVAGVDFPGPVGLAAGFDKSAEASQVTARLGFGFVEVGSVSEHASAGNAGRPRVWRLTADRALRIYYGCPNDGAEAVATRLRGAGLPVPLGVNLVETNTGVLTTAEAAAEELAACLARFTGIANYLVLNLACPNMPRGGGGLFDDPAKLAYLLGACAAAAPLPPLFLKITPPGDATDPRGIDAILQAVEPFGFLRGFNLNIPAPDPYGVLRTPRAVLDASRGGITGPLLLQPTLAAIRAWAARIDRGRHVLIGAGGITSGAEAYAMIRAGAALVQIHTAMVYQGPFVVRRIHAELAALLARDGLASVADAVGLDVPAREQLAA